ncbi:unnamed protein product [Peronospora farinosa]|uniref:HSF-type DNA-binding domain-containing protein n=1 Tax=Peronospora farinosa TaxID=134698 RepID=A0AAV0U2S0_9STRA|nr:unnamed protein product [Peronospora farinosa]CAI5729269.1 unnamed protein product [Peronospora farinosa]
MTLGVKSEKDGASYDDTDALRICVEVTSGLDHNSFETNDSHDFVSSERSGKRPRREEAALFLEKTYELLSRCPPELASWTTNGDSFVVKQPVAFAERVIPTYFKHRNFSSFVRQLNLYGFRKVRSASPVLESGAEPEGMEDSSPRGWWEFRHERFVRGRRDLLGEIRRRSATDAKVSAPPGTPVDRVEFDELRAEVGGLREEILKMQRTNLQLTGLLQTVLQRCSGAENEGETSRNRFEFAQTTGYTDSPPVAQGRPRSLPSIAVPSPTASTSVTAPQLALLQLRQGHQAIGTPRDIKTPRTPASRSFHLRPVHSLMANVRPSIRSSPSPSPRSNHNYETTPSYSQQQQEQLNRNQRRWYEATPCSQPSPTTVRSPLKRLRVDSATSITDPQAGLDTHSTGDVAVRELSRIATEIRTDLLACIIARVTGFLRVYRDQSGPTSEADADAVGEAVGSDIRLNLALLKVSTSADPMLLDVKTTCMYRVEILKFISRELPRAVQDAIYSRLLAPEKLKLHTAKDRSLVALFVQKAQKALERQMHTETAAVRRARR